MVRSGILDLKIIDHLGIRLIHCCKTSQNLTFKLLLSVKTRKKKQLHLL